MSDISRMREALSARSSGLRPRRGWLQGKSHAMWAGSRPRNQQLRPFVRQLQGQLGSLFGGYRNLGFPDPRGPQ